MNTLKAGDAVPNFTVNDQDGNPISLSDYKGKKIGCFFLSKSKHTRLYGRSLQSER